MLFSAMLMLAVQATPATGLAPADGGDKVKKICRFEGETGSRLAGKKRCQTRAQWEAEAAANQRELENQKGYNRSVTK